MNESFRLAFRGVVFACAILGSLHGFWILGSSFHKFIHGRGAVAISNSESAAIRDVLYQFGVEGKVATLSPIRVLDAGFPVYLQFSTGPFFFRTGNHLSDQEIKTLNGVSPKTMEEMFMHDPPAAIYIGYESPWSNNITTGTDATLEEFGRKAGYTEVLLGVGHSRLFLQPSGPKYGKKDLSERN